MMQDQGQSDLGIPETETNPLEKKYKGEGKNIILGITGASGSIYALRILRALIINSFNINLILTEYAHFSLFRECGVELKPSTIKTLFPDLIIREESVTFHNNLDLKSSIFSSSSGIYGMIVAPCAVNYVSGIANGSCKNLIEKCADYILSHYRPLILVPRETPVNKIYLKNLIRIIDAGGKIVPAAPSFENLPKDFNDLADFIANKVLSLLEISGTESP
ncbi:MAG: UbiX family flavin prenyltransferase [Ignavibacteria bacterium]|nr:UbiX family flavin prenyltransferase [Ignavibacteria bacterium]